MKRIVTVIALALYMLLLASFAGAQTASSSSAASPSSSSGASQTSSSASNQPSLGDYARRIRKDTGTKEKPKIYDNDNLPTQDKLSVVGPKPEPSTSADAKNSENKTGDKTDAAKADDEAKKAEWKNWQQKLTTQKD